KELARLKAHRNTNTFVLTGIRALAFTGDGRRLATPGNKLVQIWDVATGNEAANSPIPVGDAAVFTFRPDGAVLASSASNCTIKCWNVQTGMPELVLRGHTGNVKYLAFDRAGKALFSVSGRTTLLSRPSDHLFQQWDLRPQGPTHVRLQNVAARE